MLISNFALSANKKENVENILDRLERKLLESKQDSLLLSDQWNTSVRPTIKRKMKIKKKTNVSAELPSQNKLQDVDEAINQIEKEVNRLSSDMERMKEILGKQIESDSLIEIIADMNTPNDSVIRELNIVIDDYPIYKLDPNVGLWKSRTEIPIYFGPLKEGSHKIKITGRIAKVSSKDLPVDDNIFSLVNHEFSINIPKGKFHKGYKLQLKSPENKKFNIKANILEYSL